MIFFFFNLLFASLLLVQDVSSSCLSFRVQAKAMPLWTGNIADFCSPDLLIELANSSPSETTEPSSQNNNLSETSTNSPTASNSISPTKTSTSTASESSLSSSTRTPTKSTSLSASQSPSFGSSRSATTTRSPSRSPSTTPSSAKIVLIFQGTVPIGTSWTRSASTFTQAAFSLRFLVQPGNFYLGPDTTNISVTPPYLQSFSFNDLSLMYERDTNCGQSPTETKCSCEYNCGTEGNIRCCNNFHRPTLSEYDGDGNIYNGFSPWYTPNNVPTYCFKVNCNGATIPHFYVGIRPDNNVHFVSNDGGITGFREVDDTFSTLKPFIPPGTLGDIYKSHGYCKPTYPDSHGNIEEPYATINKGSSCVRTSFCSANPGGSSSSLSLSYGGCFCDSECVFYGDCCVDAQNCYYPDGSTWIIGSTYFSNQFENHCVNGLVDCDGNCFGAWAWTAVGDGICDDGRRGISLNCMSYERKDFAFDGGDCYCPSGTYMGCSGTCVESEIDTKIVCSCSDMQSAATLDCSGRCVPVLPQIICNGQNDFNVSCPSYYQLFQPEARSFDQVYQKFCKFLPESCTNILVPSYVGDLYCDYDSLSYNNANCNYDGGDCCQVSCLSHALNEIEITRCGLLGYSCIDPGEKNNSFFSFYLK